MPGLIQIYCPDNQAASVGDETCVLLGTVADLSSKKVVEFKFGSRMLKVLGSV